MVVCANCGESNIEGTKFCVKCGAQLGEAPAPESWRASGNLNAPTDAGSTTGETTGGATADAASSGYTPSTPPPPPPTGYPTYTPTQTPQTYQAAPAGGAQQMHPAVPAIVSLFLPGIGLLFLPNKQGLGIGIFAGYVVLGIIGFLLSFVVIGICLLVLMPLANIAAAIYTWDEAAKLSGGQFQPILFK
jgi:hypothetical protein